MAELKFKIIGDLSKLKKDVTDFFKEKFKIGVDGKGAKESKEGKKGNLLLTGIFGKLAIVAGVLLSLKPILDLLSLLVSLASAGLLYLIRDIGTLLKGNEDAVVKVGKDIALLPGLMGFLPLLPGSIKDLNSSITDMAISLGQILTEWFTDTINSIATGFTDLTTSFSEWFGSFVDNLIKLPGDIWEFVSQGFSDLATNITQFSTDLISELDFIIVPLEKLWDSVTNMSTNVTTYLMSLAADIWEKLKVGFSNIVDKVGNVWDSLKSLPTLFWEKMKGLGEVIANAIKNFAGGLFGGGKKETKVGDAIIRPNGDVIRTDPNDTLIATRNPEGAGGSGGTKVFNFYGVTPQEMMDVIKKELGTTQLRSSRF